MSGPVKHRESCKRASNGELQVEQSTMCTEEGWCPIPEKKMGSDILEGPKGRGIGCATHKKWDPNKGQQTGASSQQWSPECTLTRTAQLLEMKTQSKPPPPTWVACSLGLQISKEQVHRTNESQGPTRSHHGEIHKITPKGDSGMGTQHGVHGMNKCTTNHQTPSI